MLRGSKHSKNEVVAHKEEKEEIEEDEDEEEEEMQQTFLELTLTQKFCECNFYVFLFI